MLEDEGQSKTKVITVPGTSNLEKGYPWREIET